MSTDSFQPVSPTLSCSGTQISLSTQLGTQIVRASTSCKGTNVQMDKQRSERHVCMYGCRILQKNGFEFLLLVLIFLVVSFQFSVLSFEFSVTSFSDFTA